MIAIGLLVTLLGFVLSLMSLGMTSSVNGRLMMVLAGIAVSFFGIIGMINPAYLKKAIWRK
ncbi:MAG: hypothetical protein ABIZ80_19020 [Bryobacteraceae bacterium]